MLTLNPQSEYDLLWWLKFQKSKWKKEQKTNKEQKKENKQRNSDGYEDYEIWVATHFCGSIFWSKDIKMVPISQGC